MHPPCDPEASLLSLALDFASIILANREAPTALKPPDKSPAP
jgi:hypothetical protein